MAMSCYAWVMELRFCLRESSILKPWSSVWAFPVWRPIRLTPLWLAVQLDMQRPSLAPFSWAHCPPSLGGYEYEAISSCTLVWFWPACEYSNICLCLSFTASHSSLVIYSQTPLPSGRFWPICHSLAISAFFRFLLCPSEYCVWCCNRLWFWPLLHLFVRKDRRGWDPEWLPCP